MDFEPISRRESRKRRRLSERRRLFSNRLGQQSQMSFTSNNNNQNSPQEGDCQPMWARSDSPVGGDQQRISMKIQFHIAVAPENEPLIVSDSLNLHQQSSQQTKPPPASSTIGQHIQEKLNISRQNSTNGSTKRRQQRPLLAKHNSTTSSGGNDSPTGSSFATDTPLSQTILDNGEFESTTGAQSDDNLVRRRREDSAGQLDGPAGVLPPMSGGGRGPSREAGARSSTITGGMADEATMRFLQRTGDHQQQATAKPQRYSSAANLSTSSGQIGAADRERIYFKRDGHRFGHEFTLKLAVERTYRCMLKVRPLIPLQSISIQGHQLLFVDCSQQPTSGGGGGGSAPGSTASSTVALNQRLRSGSAVMAAVPSRHSSQPVNDAYLKKHNHQENHQQHNHHLHNHHQRHHNQLHHNHHHHQHHHATTVNPTRSHHPSTGLYHAQTKSSLYRVSLDQTEAPAVAATTTETATATATASLQLTESMSLYRQQQNQMMRHFAASYCSSSNSHLGNQLIYMFDWPASRFEVNKNKNRTQIQTVLKFKNGQILSLPLQVKFYQSDCRQHLEWGSQLHFIDYDCQINQLGQISVDRIQYY